MPRRGDRIELEIRELTAQGDGWTRVGDSEFIVRRTLPGDRVEATVRRRKGGTWEATADRITSTRIPRVAPECPHFGVCGGCRWQDICYGDQLRLKEGMVANALEQQGLRCDEQRPIIASRAPFFYRNKMEFSFGRDCGGGTLLGLHHRGRYNRVFDVRDCRLQSQLSNRIVETVRSCASAGKVPVYDLQTHGGILRFLVVREGKNSGEVMVNLVVSEYPDKGVGDLVRCVLERVPEITTFVVTLHRGKAQAAIGEREFVLKGSGRISEVCGGFEFEISAPSFFQTNTGQAAVLYEQIAALAGDLTGATVLDLYCGTGGISLHLAKRADKVIGVEQVEEAVADAGVNVQKNGTGNCTFMAGPVEKVIATLMAENERFDLVIADPPRAGIPKSVLRALIGMRPPSLVYVSCNPTSLAADARVLCEGGLRLRSLQPIDLFPQTPHCEAIAHLTPA